MDKKTLVLLFTIVLVCLIIGIITIFSKENKTNDKITDLDSFYFNYSSGYAMYAYTTYEVEKKGTYYQVSIKPNGISDEKKYTKIENQDFVDKLLKIINDYDVISWDGFNKNDKYVLDGNSFTLRLKGDKNISATGYMMWPDNYYDVKNELNNLFMEYYE